MTIRQIALALGGLCLLAGALYWAWPGSSEPLSVSAEGASGFERDPGGRLSSEGSAGEESERESVDEEGLLRVQFLSAEDGSPVTAPCALHDPRSGEVVTRGAVGEAACEPPGGCLRVEAEGFLPSLVRVDRSGYVLLHPAESVVVRCETRDRRPVPGTKCMVSIHDAALDDWEWLDRARVLHAASAAARVELPAAQCLEALLEVPRGFQGSELAVLPSRPVVEWVRMTDETGRAEFAVPAGLGLEWSVYTPSTVTSIEPPRPRRDGGVLSAEMPAARSGRFQATAADGLLAVLEDEDGIVGHVERSASCSNAPVALELSTLRTSMRNGIERDRLRQPLQALPLERDGPFEFVGLPPGPKMLTAAWECEERELYLVWQRVETRGSTIDLGNLADLVRPGRIELRIVLDEEPKYSGTPPSAPLQVGLRAVDPATSRGLWSSFPVDTEGGWKFIGLEPGSVEVTVDWNFAALPEEAGAFVFPRARVIEATAYEPAVVELVVKRL